MSITTSEIEFDHLVRALRIYVADLSDQHSPFNKDMDYLRNLSGWIACAATRLETLNVKLNERSLAQLNTETETPTQAINEENASAENLQQAYSQKE